MDASSAIFQLLSQLAVRLPLLLVCLVGIVLALNGRARAPRAALFAALGAGILLLDSLFSLAWYQFAFPLLMRNNAGLRMIGWVNAVVSFLFNLGSALGVGLLLTAAFTGRTRAARPDYTEPKEDDERPWQRRSKDIVEGPPRS
jgi:hypothetical protein